MRILAQLVTAAVKLFVLGLLVRIVLSWLRSPATRAAERWLDRIYEPLLAPIRRLIPPVRLGDPNAPRLDLAPLILLLAIWLLIHPLLMWILL